MLLSMYSQSAALPRKQQMIHALDQHPVHLNNIHRPIPPNHTTLFPPQDSDIVVKTLT